MQLRAAQAFLINTTQLFLSHIWKELTDHRNNKKCKPQYRGEQRKVKMKTQLLLWWGFFYLCGPISCHLIKDKIESVETNNNKKDNKSENGTDVLDEEGQERYLSLPSFTWTSRISLHAVYPDMEEDDISLKLANTIDGLIDCLYKGTFIMEQKASATVSGCQGDDETYITIFSRHLRGRTMFIIQKRSGTKEIYNPYSNLTNATNQIHYDDYDSVDNLSNRTKRSIMYEDYEYEAYEYEDKDYDYDVASDTLVGKHPLTLQIKLAFDMSLVDVLGSETAAREYTLKVHEHGKAYMLHQSLGIQVYIQPIGTPRYIRRSLGDLGTLKDIINSQDFKDLKENEPKPLMLIVSKEDDNVDMGLSNIRKACDSDFGLAIMKRRKNIAIAAVTYIHEFSHLCGMQHTRTEQNKSPTYKVIPGAKCETLGIMSELIEGEFTVEQRLKVVDESGYSKCSAARFAKWYKRSGNTCMIPGILNIDDKDAKCELLTDKCKSFVSLAGDELNSGCEKPRQITNGDWSCSEDGQVCHFLCDPGYKPTHHSASKTFVRCGNKQWDNNIANFRCSCDLNYKPQNAESMTCTGLECQVTCRDGYSTPQPDKMTCLEGTWDVDPENLDCAPNPVCPKPSPTENGLWQCSDGDCKCSLSCTQGYQPSDDQEISYQEDQNEWSMQIDTFECLVASEPVQQLVVTGGYDAESKRLATSELISSDGVLCHHKIPNLPVAVYGASSVYFNNHLLVCGGYSDSGYQDSCHQLGSSTSTWTAADSLKIKRYYFSLTKVDEELYAVGGEGSGGRLDSIEKLVAGKWQLLSQTMETPRSRHCAVYMASKKSLIVIGGSPSTNEVKSLDINSLEWSTLDPLPVSYLYAHSCQLIQENGEDTIYVTGGYHGGYQSNVWKYSRGSWSSAGGQLKQARWRHSMGARNGRLQVVGGEDGSGKLASLEQMDSIANWETMPTKLAMARSYHSIAAVPVESFKCLP